MLVVAVKQPLHHFIIQSLYAELYTVCDMKVFSAPPEFQRYFVSN